jgi:hypothetical protein
MKERQKAIDSMMEKEKLARKNVENFLKQQEKDRQKLQKTTDGKSKLNFFNFYNFLFSFVFY